MTSSDIDKMETGREMDALMAEKVIGFVFDKCDQHPPFCASLFLSMSGGTA